jgi:hypothetical protein
MPARATLGFKTILGLSGGTRREDLDRYAYQPDKIVDSIADLDHRVLAIPSTVGDSGIPKRSRRIVEPRCHRAVGHSPLVLCHS